jgi:hypothetical protein
MTPTGTLGGLHEARLFNLRDMWCMKGKPSLIAAACWDEECLPPPNPLPMSSVLYG